MEDFYDKAHKNFSRIERMIHPVEKMAHPPTFGVNIKDTKHNMCHDTFNGWDQSHPHINEYASPQLTKHLDT